MLTMNSFLDSGKMVKRHGMLSFETNQLKIKSMDLLLHFINKRHATIERDNNKFERNFDSFYGVIARFTIQVICYAS